MCENENVQLPSSGAKYSTQPHTTLRSYKKTVRHRDPDHYIYNMDRPKESMVSLR
jgi:hypothetical protein